MIEPVLLEKPVRSICPWKPCWARNALEGYLPPSLPSAQFPWPRIWIICWTFEIVDDTFTKCER